MNKPPINVLPYDLDKLRKEREKLRKEKEKEKKLDQSQRLKRKNAIELIRQSNRLSAMLENEFM